MCSSGRPMYCCNRFVLDECEKCDKRVKLMLSNDNSFYTVNVFSVKKTILVDARSKLDFLNNFVSILSVKYGGVDIVEYSFGEDRENANYYECKVVVNVKYLNRG